MKEFGVEKSWTQLANISYQHLQIDSFPIHTLPICISKNGHVVVLASNEYLQVILYNWRDNKVEHAEIPSNKIWADPKDYIKAWLCCCEKYVCLQQFACMNLQ